MTPDLVAEAESVCRNARTARVEVLTRAEQRQSWTAEQKRQIVAESPDSDLAATEVPPKYCRRHGRWALIRTTKFQKGRPLPCTTRRAPCSVEICSSGRGPRPRATTCSSRSSTDRSLTKPWLALQAACPLPWSQRRSRGARTPHPRSPAHVCGPVSKNVPPTSTRSPAAFSRSPPATRRRHVIAGLRADMCTGPVRLDASLPRNPHVRITNRRGGWITVSPAVSSVRPVSERLRRRTRQLSL